MRLSVEICIMREKFDDFKGIEMIKKAGFDAVDYSFYWLEGEDKEMILGRDFRTYAQRVRKALDAAGLVCNQAHAPFDITVDDDYDMTNEKFAEVVHCMESAAIMGAEHIIVHAVSTDIESNYIYYKALEPYCEKFGIKIAVENLFIREGDVHHSQLGTPDELNEMLNRLDSDWFIICIDVGHAQLTYGSPEKFIASTIPQKIKALHVHDNDLTFDAHKLPYMGKLNWDAITKSLANINYNGDLTFEVVKFFTCFDSEETLQSALYLAHAVGRELIEKIEK